MINHFVLVRATRRRLLTLGYLDYLNTFNSFFFIEIDGPPHYYVGTTLPTAATLMKRRQLQQLNWHVCDIPFFEFQQCTTEQQRSEYIYSKLMPFIDSSA